MKAHTYKPGLIKRLYNVDTVTNNPKEEKRQGRKQNKVEREITQTGAPIMMRGIVNETELRKAVKRK